MQPVGAGAVQGQAAEGDDPGHGVVGEDNARAGEFVVDKALRQKAAEEALDHAVLEVQVHDIVVDVAGIAKYDRPDGRLFAPLPGLLPALAGRAQGVEGGLPAGVGAHALMQFGQQIAGVVGLAGGLFRVLRGEWAVTDHFQGCGDGLAKVGLGQAEKSPGFLQHVLQDLDLGFELVLAVARLFEFLLDDAHARAGQGVAVAGALAPGD